MDHVHPGCVQCIDLAVGSRGTQRNGGFAMFWQLLQLPFSQ
jgi:hypothetical protein